MIVVDKNSEVFEWVRALDHEAISCVRLDIDTFEIASGLQTELILIHEDLLVDTLMEKLGSCAGVIIFSEQKSSPHKNIKTLLAVIRKDDVAANSANILVNNEERIKSDNILKSQLISMDTEISRLMGSVESELWKVKNSHEQILPRRLEKIDGVKIFSKYSAGESSGGEFFDLFSQKGNVVLMMSHTSSYLASSIIVQCFSEFKKVGLLSPDKQKSLISRIEKKVAILSESQDREIDLKILTGVFNLESRQMNLIKKGEFQFFHSGCEAAQYLDQEVISIDHEERLMISSPGFKENWNGCDSCVDIEKLVHDPIIKSLDILDETFYQLKKAASSDFLKTDAAVIILEVEQDA